MNVRRRNAPERDVELDHRVITKVVSAASRQIDEARAASFDDWAPPLVLLQIQVIGVL